MKYEFVTGASNSLRTAEENLASIAGAPLTKGKDHWHQAIEALYGAFECLKTGANEKKDEAHSSWLKQIVDEMRADEMLNYVNVARQAKPIGESIAQSRVCS